MGRHSQSDCVQRKKEKNPECQAFTLKSHKNTNN